MDSNITNNIEIVISTQEELISALENITENTTILLESGNYGELTLSLARQPYIDFAHEVTIKSADPEDPASFSGIRANGVSNLTFDTVVFDYDADPGVARYAKPFEFKNASNITIRNSVFEGDEAEGVSATEDGFGTGFGLTVTASTDILVEGNEFHNLYRGGVFGDIDGLIVKDNEVYNVSSDGFDFAEVSNVLIEGNYLHDFRGGAAAGSGAHADAIQFFSSGADKPSTDVIIRGNIIDSGDGDATQSIFIRNEAVDSYDGGPDLFYQNFLIEDNVIHNSVIHGITVGETDGLTIRNNTLIQNADAGDNGGINIPSINVTGAAVNVVVENNITPAMAAQANPEHIYRDNLIVQQDDPNLDNYVGDLFIDGLAGANSTSTSFIAIEGSAADGVGAEATSFNGAPSELRGAATTETGEGLESLSVTFGLRDVVGPNGAVDLTDASIVWDFGDGQTVGGQDVVHTFARSGSFQTTARIELSSGEVFEVARTVNVETPFALSLEAVDGELVDTTDFQNSVTVSDEVEVIETGEVQGIRLNGGLVNIDASDDFLNNDQYTFSFDFQKDGPNGSTDRIVQYASSFVFSVGDDRVSAAIATDQGGIVLKATELNLADGNKHNVSVTFSGETGEIILYVDGVSVATETGFEGAVQQGSSSHDIILGDPYDRSQFEGVIDNVKFVTAATDGGVIPDMPQNPLPESEVVEPVETPDPQPEPEPTETSESEESETEQSNFEETHEIYNGTVGNDRIKTGNDDDYVLAGDGRDSIQSGGGNDVLYGGAGDDSIASYDGDDFIDGGEGVDAVVAGAGDDTVVFDEDDSFYRGNDGFDTLKVSSKAGEITDLSSVRFAGFEKIDTTDGAVNIISVGKRDAENSDNGSLQIVGDNGDVVRFEQAGTFEGIVTIGENTFFEFSSTRYSQTTSFFIEDDLVVADASGNILAGQENLLDADGGVTAQDEFFALIENQGELFL